MIEGVLPFSRWNFAPEHDEPAHGYSLRLIDAHGINSAVTFNIWNGIDSDAVSPQGSMSLLEAHPLPVDWLSSLWLATPREDRKVAYMGGQMFSAAQISQWNRRWCPGCIAEKAYHRNWWDIVALRKCPLHGVELLQEDVEGKAVSWTWPQFGFSRGGWDLGRRMVRAETDGIGRYVLGRLGYVAAVRIDILDGVAVRDVIDVSEIFGKFLANPRMEEIPKPGVDDIDNGFHALRGGGPSVAEAARAWLRRFPPPADNNPAVDAQFGWLSKKTSAIRDLGLKRLLRRALKEARTFEVSGVKRRIKAADFLIDYVPAAHLARDLGLQPAGLISIADELGLRHTARLRDQLAKGDADQIRAFVDSLIGPDETAKRLGIHKDAIRHLVHAGYLKVFKGLNPGKRNGARYDLGRVSKLLSIIEGLPIDGNPDFSITFDLYRKRNKLVPGKLATDVLEGRHTLSERRTDAPGFKSLMIETTHRRQRHAFGRSHDMVTIGQAQAILNLSHVTVMVLVERGLLGTVDRRPRFTLLYRSRVSMFAKRHAKVADFAPALGLHPIQLFKKLSKAGVKPVVAWNHNGQRTETVVRRKDVVAALGLDHDPSVVSNPRLIDYWTSLVAKVRDRCPYLFMPDALPFGGQRAWQNSTFSAVFCYDPTWSRLLIEMVPYGNEREFLELDVTEHANPSEVDRFLDKLVLSIERSQEFSRMKVRENYHRKRGGEKSASAV